MLFQTVVIFLITYITTIWLWYRRMQKIYYHPEGRWYGLNPANTDIFIVLCPFANTFWYITDLIIGWKKENKVTWFKPKDSNKWQNTTKH